MRGRDREAPPGAAIHRISARGDAVSRSTGGTSGSGEFRDNTKRGLDRLESRLDRFEQKTDGERTRLDERLRDMESRIAHLEGEDRLTSNQLQTLQKSQEDLREDFKREASATRDTLDRFSQSINDTLSNFSVPVRRASSPAVAAVEAAPRPGVHLGDRSGLVEVYQGWTPSQKAGAAVGGVAGGGAALYGVVEIIAAVVKLLGGG